MIIEYATMNDKNDILKLWKEKENVKNLSIPWNEKVDKFLNEKRMFCIKQNGEIIAFGGFTVMKRFPEIRIEHLCVNKEYRNKRLATAIMKRIVEEVKDIDLPIIITCRDGAENNTFYEKFKLNNYTLIEKKSLNVRKYVLDKDKILNY